MPGLSALLLAALREMCPQLVMNDAETYVSSCEFAYFTHKIMAACDMLDGYNDGIVINPEDCEFEPERLVVDKIACEGQKTIMTALMATVIRKIREGLRGPLGAKIRYGLTPVTNHGTLANITTGPDGTRAAYHIALPVLDNLLLPPGVNPTSFTPADYFALWAQAPVEWGWTLLTESTGFTGLRDSCTKLLSWHSSIDDTIPHEGTVEFSKRLQRHMSGAYKVDEFYPLFLAPGAGHCALGKDRCLRSLSLRW
ncbi:hypothetical protein E8E13_010006 [Curvularia kusanoi]|uniref:Carboxylic ester hydrolase n=1 Tax=Curvularia kusanoi TaxID=90978 RepID=A0A9P4TMP2_CURKU|nr:hypothetical protein E8E13_010006 [Curvularia kusanoi]